MWLFGAALLSAAARLAGEWRRKGLKRLIQRREMYGLQFGVPSYKASTRNGCPGGAKGTEKQRKDLKTLSRDQNCRAAIRPPPQLPPYHATGLARTRGMRTSRAFRSSSLRYIIAVIRASE